jgi:hypothetical protein
VRSLPSKQAFLVLLETGGLGVLAECLPHIFQEVQINRLSTAMTHAMMLSEGHNTVGILRAAKGLVELADQNAI